MKATLAFLLAAGLVLVPDSLRAELTLRTVTVGDSGNKPDANGLGRVDHVFNITEKRITNSIYSMFLNAVDAYGTNRKSLYNSRMSQAPRGGVLFDSTADPGKKYRPARGMEEEPIFFVNWIDAARFCNWLANGSKLGSSTEIGTYNLIKSQGQITQKTSDSSYWIPDADELYKAANYMPNGLWRSISGLLQVDRTPDGRLPSPAIQLQTVQNRVREIVDVEIPNMVRQLVSSVNPMPEPSGGAPVFEAMIDPGSESSERSFYIATLPVVERDRIEWPGGGARRASADSSQGAVATDEEGGGLDDAAPVNVEFAIYQPPPPVS